MGEYVPIPTTVAREIAEKFAKQVVVILGVDYAQDRTHVTTYGINADHKAVAAAMGLLCFKAVSDKDAVPLEKFEDFRDVMDAALFRECLEIMQKVVARNGATTPQIVRMEEILKSQGMAPRTG